MESFQVFGPITKVGLPYMGYIGMCSWVEGIIVAPVIVR